MIAVIGMFSIVSCSKTEDSNPEVSLPAGPQDTVTSFMVYFTNNADSVTEVASYDDPDGPGPKPANVGGVTLVKNAVYTVTFRIEDATNPSKAVNLLQKIQNNKKDYKVCISNPMGISIQADDSDGTYPVGLLNTLTTGNQTGYEQMNFTIKYQKDVKNGQCSPGVVYYSCNIPVGVN